MKQQRHTAIREVLIHSSVPSQDELRRRLARRGFHVTQATLSRDIHELRLSKGPAGYALPGNLPEDDEDSLPGIREVLGSFGIEVRQAMNQLVLITTTSAAQPVAAGIDYGNHIAGRIVNTISGQAQRRGGAVQVGGQRCLEVGERAERRVDRLQRVRC